MPAPRFNLFLLCFAVAVVGSILILAPNHNAQWFLAQGDHGRDLYAAQAVLHGDLPYKDFWWVYGPLMPYYYALFYVLLGVKISSVLIGKIVLKVLAAAFLYLAMTRFFAPAIACIAALWFATFHQDFFITYNHAGGVTLVMAVVWMHWGYIATSKRRYEFGALCAVFILGLIKINFALVALLMTVLTIASKDWLTRTPGSNIFAGTRKKMFYVLAALGLPVIWFGIYAFLLQGLSIAEIRQCFPYLGGDEPYNKLGPLQTIPMVLQTIWSNINYGWADKGMCVVVILSTLTTGFLLLSRKLEPARRTMIALTLSTAALFYVLNMHEFLKSGVGYRAFWAQPLSLALMFGLIATALSVMPRIARALLIIAMAGLIAVGNYSLSKYFAAIKTPAHFLGGPRAGVYVNNDRAWLQTVVLTVEQINERLGRGQPFAAVPYDCLYYFLTDTKAPTRQLIFFDHINIPPEQEQKIIMELEHNHTAGMLVSSRQNAREQGLGTMGVSYCPLLAQYINTNFEPVAKIGDWTNEPGWAWNHGTLLLKRKSTPSTAAPASTENTP